MFELRNKGEQLVPPVGSLPIPLGIQDLFISAHTLRRLLLLPIFKSLVNIKKEKRKAIPRARESYLPCFKERGKTESGDLASFHYFSFRDCKEQTLLSPILQAGGSLERVFFCIYPNSGEIWSHQGQTPHTP